MVSSFGRGFDSRQLHLDIQSNSPGHLCPGELCICVGLSMLTRGGILEL